MHPTTKSTLKLLTRMKSLRLKEKSITCQILKESKRNSKGPKNNYHSRMTMNGVDSPIRSRQHHLGRDELLHTLKPTKPNIKNHLKKHNPEIIFSKKEERQR